VTITGVSPKATRAGVDVAVLISTKIVVSGTAPVPSIDTGKVFVVGWIGVMIGAVGGMVSSTVMVNVADPGLPDVSVAEHVTVLIPSANVLPEAGVHVAGKDPSTMSEAVAAEYVTTAPDGDVATVMILAGVVTVGGVLSSTVMVNVADPGLPAASVAEHVTGVSPSANILPEIGVHVAGKAPSTLSEAVSPEYITKAPDGDVASTPVISAGVVTVGGMVSSVKNTSIPESDGLLVMSTAFAIMI